MVALVIALFLFGGPDVFERVEPHVMPLYKDSHSKDIVCSVFRVEHRLVSAVHCFENDKDELEPRYLRGGRKVTVEWHVDDLAVLAGRERQRGLELKEDAVKPNDVVYGFGYAFGERPMKMKPGTVAGRPVRHERYETLMLPLNIDLVGGQSGGPVTDDKGRVVTLNNFIRVWHSSGVAYALGQELLWEYFNQR